YSCQTTDIGYTLRPFTSIEDVTHEFDTAKVIANEVNENNLMGGQKSFVFRINLDTDNTSLSPIIDMQQTGVVLIKNLINNPSYDSEHLGMDVVTVAVNSNISFTNLSANSGLISIVNAADKANAAGIIKGTMINVSNSSLNSGRYRVIDILDSGANIKVSGNITTQSASNVITITNGVSFVAEE